MFRSSKFINICGNKEGMMKQKAKRGESLRLYDLDGELFSDFNGLYWNCCSLSDHAVQVRILSIVVANRGKLYPTVCHS